MSVPPLRVLVGKQRFTEAPRWPSENDYIASINRQSRGLEKAFATAMQGFKDVSIDIMIDALRPTFELTQKEVPVDTGRLKQSGYLQKVSTGREKPRVEIGYGYRNSPWYAQLVHENMNAWHRYPTKAKFLQDPVMADMQNIWSRIFIAYQKFFS